MRRFPLQVLAVTALPIGLGAHVPLVWAQSSTTIYGILDANVRHDQGSNSSANSVSSGLSRGSRLGFKVIEDLGSGLSAMSFLEMGFNVNSGEILSSGSVAPGFGRQSWLALGSRDLGYWALGRQYTPIFALSAGALDPFGANYLGTITTTQAIQGGLTSRVSGALTYSYGYQFAMESPTPRKGASFSALYAPGAVANSNAGTQAGLAFGYGQGNWFLGYGYHPHPGERHRHARILQSCAVGAGGGGDLRSGAPDAFHGVASDTQRRQRRQRHPAPQPVVWNPDSGGGRPVHWSVPAIERQDRCQQEHLEFLGGLRALSFQAHGGVCQLRSQLEQRECRSRSLPGQQWRHGGAWILAFGLGHRHAS